MAKNKNYILKAHIGDFGDAKSIKNVVNELNLNQIQHEINLVDSEEVISLIKEKNIQLNICSSSNVYLKRTKSNKDHPIKKLFKIGLKITINTDDMIIFDNSVSQKIF